MIWSLCSLVFAQAAPEALDEDPRQLERAVSRSRGRTGGVLVLWPRVIPATEDSEVRAAAAAMQARAIELANRASPLTPREVRPSPERVCPRERGCKAVSLTVLVAHEGGGCAAVAVIGKPGMSDLRLVPLAGRVSLSSTSVPFRAPPESVLTTHELVPCRDLATSVDDGDAVLVLRKALE